MNAYFDDNSVRMGVGVCVVMVVIVRVYTDVQGEVGCTEEKGQGNT